MPKCGFCRTQTTNKIGLKTLCSIDCAIGYGRQQKEKREREAEKKRWRERKEKAKTRNEWLDDVQSVVNAYIRERDRGLPCISCGTFNPNIQYCAGHYLTRGAHPELRFEPLNIHKQCNKHCNLEKSGNQQQYRIGLLMRIGAEKVEWLEGPHEPKKYTIDELKALKAEYKQKLKDLKIDPVYPVI